MGKMEHNLREKYCRIEQKAVSLRRKKRIIFRNEKTIVIVLDVEDLRKRHFDRSLKQLKKTVNV